MNHSAASSFRNSNNITLLRHFAAFFVLITHSYGLTNKINDEFLEKITGQSISLSRVGLIIFFFISGFLITQSLVSSSSIKQFLWKRFLRIYPALIVLMILTVFVLGPAFTELPVKKYFASSETWQFLLGTSLIRMRFVLPGVFNVEGVNGSLWSLPIEFRLYLLLALLSVIGFIKKRRLFFLFVFLFLIGALIIVAGHLSVPFFAVISPYMFWGMYFLTGSFVFFIKDKIKLDYKILLALLALWYFTRNIETISVITELVAFSYFTLVMSFKTPVVFNKFFEQNDFSYSMYLYAFPLQQIFIYKYAEISPIILSIVTCLALIPFCWFSWNFVEKPTLKLKRLKI